jgi:hypothetical protein
MTREKIKAEYKRLKDAAPILVRCHVCGVQAPKKYMDPHHPWGRHGDLLLKFVWVHRSCHDATHADPAAAKRAGLMGLDAVHEKQYHSDQ